MIRRPRFRRFCKNASLLLGLAFLGQPLGAELASVEGLPVETASPLPEPERHARPLRRSGQGFLPDRFLSSGREEFFPSIGGPGGNTAALTQQYIRQYSSPGGIAWLNSVMERGGPYLGFIRKELARRNLPPELIYLPVIESSYVTSAMSRSGAAGLWQFMKNSIGPFDIRITDWVDERMDFWKSTEAALRKLEENYRYFKDWPLALAAYNAGTGAIRQIVTRTGIQDYWTLSEKRQLKAETVQYIPKLLAVSYILSNPRRFGFDPVWVEDPQWTRLRLERPVNLELLAKQAGLDPDLLHRANRELRFRVTPPESGYELKVPAADAAAISAALEQRDFPLLNYYVHFVKSGDTLSALARHYGLTVDQILSSNPGTQAHSLKIGSQLLIPALRADNPSPQPLSREAAPAFEGTYRVRAGDTLWSIARTFRVDPEVLAEVNGMTLRDILPIGRVLKTPIR
ncbi:MAG: LysM peptidoglycan-binding domain-containing protein [Treponema sp.]|nr:LysM peptidoglycan-binding domain-containing protein [Treponema sp.]